MSAARRSATRLPRRPGVGARMPLRYDFWAPAQPGPVHHKGARELSLSSCRVIAPIAQLRARVQVSAVGRYLQAAGIWRGQAWAARPLGREGASSAKSQSG